MKALVLLLLAGCATAPAAKVRHAREESCLTVCLAELHATNGMAIVEGNDCLCWAPLNPGEAERQTWVRIVMP